MSRPAPGEDGLDAQRLEGHGARGARTRVGEAAPPVGHRRAGHHEVDHSGAAGAADVPAAVERRGALGQRHADRGEHRLGLGADEGEQRQLARRVAGLDLGPEDHLGEVGQQLRELGRLDVEVDDVADLRDPHVVQHPALPVEHQGLGGAAVGQRADVLGEQQVQPFEPVGAGHRDDPAVAAVDDGRVAGHRALLGERVAVVGGYRVVEAVVGEGHGAS